MNAAPGAAILVSDPIDYFVKAKAEAIIPLPDNNRGLLSYPVLKEGESLLRVLCGAIVAGIYRPGR